MRWKLQEPSLVEVTLCDVTCFFFISFLTMHLVPVVRKKMIPLQFASHSVLVGWRSWLTDQVSTADHVSAPAFQYRSSILRLGRSKDLKTSVYMYIHILYDIYIYRDWCIVTYYDVTVRLPFAISPMGRFLTTRITCHSVRTP